MKKFKFILIALLFISNSISAFRIFNMIDDNLSIYSSPPNRPKKYLRGPINLYQLSQDISPVSSTIIATRPPIHSPYLSDDAYNQSRHHWFEKYHRRQRILFQIGLTCKYFLNLLPFNLETLKDPNTVIVVALDKNKQFIYELTDIKNIYEKAHEILIEQEYLDQLEIANKISDLQRKLDDLEKEKKSEFEVPQEQKQKLLTDIATIRQLFAKRKELFDQRKKEMG